MHHYVEIQRVREQDIVVDAGLTLPMNTEAFRKGDIISITEKIDGANTSIYYDLETEKLRCFSSNQELDVTNHFRGFFQYVQGLNIEPFRDLADYIFYGEWLVKHTTIYDEKNYNHWYLFSIYDKKSYKWLPQNFVKNFAKQTGIPYVHELYYGEFVSWEHCFSFANNPFYGDQQEGIVIKNQTALEEGRKPHVLKYVNPEFDEAVVHRRKRRPDAAKRRKEREIAEEYIRMIVTEARVRKLFHKLIDDGVLPEKIEKADLKLVVKYLPKAVYDDCVKEQIEILNKAGEYAGKLCGKVTMEIIDEILT